MTKMNDKVTLQDTSKVRIRTVEEVRTLGR